ncbi:hypothetical protein D9M71_836890 [compost metagenome]
MARFSSALNHLAEAGLSSSQYQANTPASTGGMPVITNSHCQPAKPPTPAKCPMMLVDSGPPIIPHTAIAMMKREVMRARWLAGNQ